MKKSGLIVLALVVLSNLAVWAWFNPSHTAQAWTGTIRGVSFSPYLRHQNPLKDQHPDADSIKRDLELLQGQVSSIRTYSSTDGMELIPHLAWDYGLRVTAGAWLDHRRERNDAELRNLIRNAKIYRNIDRVIVGNEAILRGDLTVSELIGYLREVRKRVTVPVSTAEPWHVWLKHPELAREVDFIAVHVLPYWEKVPAEDAVDWVLDRYLQVRKAFPHKHVLLAEVGWPSGGNRLEVSTPSLVNQAQFVRKFLNEANARGLDYFIMEAFDQPWKRAIEGAAGAHWGIFTADRTHKFPLSGSIVEVSAWPIQVTVATLLALFPMGWFLRRWHDRLRLGGQLFFAGLIQAAVSLAVWAAFTPVTQELPTTATLMWGVLFPAQLILLAVVLINGFEMAELIWNRRWRRQFLPQTPPADAPLPKVSLHLAICNEPPEMVKLTLDSLAALDYPNFEVLVIDNNTLDPAVWQPVQEYCAKLGPRFRFFHLGKWPGFKAGALNFGLKQTAPDAEIIGVVDSDYIVRRDWLRALVPYFADEKVGFVQAPQDHREWEGDAFKTMLNWEYTGFFHIGMVHRNEYDAIIQHGTMTLIRKSALEGLGGWSEWCICEDAELGLRLYQEGYRSVYVNESFGQGLTPDTFDGYKRQRFRWAYGAVMILKRHWRALLPGKTSPLTAGQRYHFVTGWLPWFADAMHLIFTLLALLWTAGLVALPKYFEFPLTAFIVPTVGIFLFKLVHSLSLYHVRVSHSTWPQRLGAAVAGMSLTLTIGRAMLAGLFTSSQPFLRTPKCESRPALIKSVLMAREEFLLFMALWLASAAILWRYELGNVEVLFWLGVLVVQSIPYAAALVVSVVNVLPSLNLPGWGKLVLARAT